MSDIETHIKEFFDELELDQSLKNDLPFGKALQSRICVANILSFVDRGPPVCQILQNLSKRGRAFMIS